MIYCKELDQSFLSKKEMFDALKKNLGEIIDFKKSSIQKSTEKGSGVKARFISEKIISELGKAITIDSDYYYIAVNTTNILDSHRDLHVKGIWDKTVKEQQGQNYLVLDHDLSITSVVVRKNNLEMLIADIPFSMVGQSYEGNTQALIYKFKKTDVVHPMAAEWLLSGEDIEASVRMQYVKILFALDSKDDEDQEFKANFDKYYPQIANKEDFEELEYYWVVLEAKNVRESSLVLAGSNFATGPIKDNPAAKALAQKEEAAKALLQSQIDYYLKN